MALKSFVNDVRMSMLNWMEVERVENDVRRRFNDSPKHILPFLIEIESIRGQLMDQKGKASFFFNFFFNIEQNDGKNERMSSGQKIKNNGNMDEREKLKIIIFFYRQLS
jgi:hypothetical protein